MKYIYRSVSHCISNFEGTFYRATSSVMSWTNPKSFAPLLNGQNLLSVTRAYSRKLGRQHPILAKKGMLFSEKKGTKNFTTPIQYQFLFYIFLPKNNALPTQVS